MKWIMTSYLLTFLFSLFTLSLIGQNRSGTIAYKIKPPKMQDSYLDTTHVKNQSTKHLFAQGYNRLVKTCPYLDFTLHFNRDEAIFNMPDVMNNDNGIHILETLRAIGITGTYYINTDKKTSLRQRKSFGEYWRIRRSISDFDWTITSQTKQLKGYSCRKATMTFYPDPVTELNIVAWFCPELPFQFGPAGFSGLPGLILELHYRKFTLYADHIKFSESPQKIKKPSKGTVVSPEEYDEKVLENNPSEKAYRRSKKKKND